MGLELFKIASILLGLIGISLQFRFEDSFMQSRSPSDPMPEIPLKSLLRSKELLIINDLVFRLLISVCSCENGTQADPSMSEFLSLQLLPIKNQINKQILLSGKAGKSTGNYPGFLEEYSKLLKCSKMVQTGQRSDMTSSEAKDVSSGEVTSTQKAVTTTEMTHLTSSTSMHNFTKSTSKATASTTPKVTTTEVPTTPKPYKPGPVTKFFLKTYKNMANFFKHTWRTIKGWFSSSKDKRQKRSILEEKSNDLGKMYKDAGDLINRVCPSDLQTKDKFYKDVTGEIIGRLGSNEQSTLEKDLKRNRIPELMLKCFQTKGL